MSYAGVDVLRALEGARNYNALLVRLVELHVNGAQRLLDFGAGVGTFSRLLRERGYEVVCVEHDPELAALLEENGFEAHTDLNAIEDGSVRFAFSLNVLEHIGDDRAALRELATKVTSGGMLFIYVPAFQWLWTSLDDKVGHQRRYTKWTLKNLALSCELDVISIGYADCVGIAAALLFKLFGNQEGRLTAGAIRAYDRWGLPITAVLDRLFHRFMGKNVWIACRKA